MHLLSTAHHRPRRWLAVLPALATGFFLLASRPATLRAEVRGFDTVIVDAGHGGHDRGGVPGQRGIPEKEATLDTARRLERRLRSRGFRVIMTRTYDEFISLGSRVNTTFRFDPRRTVFVSVHYNSARREGADGIETYYYRADSFGLAARLHQEILAVARTENRFVRRRPFYVIRRAGVPAVLLEMGFLTNGAEERRIASGRYRQQLADAVANGLVAQQRAGNLNNLGYQPPVTSVRSTYVRSSGRSSRRSSYSRRGGRGSRYASYRRSSRGGGGRKYARSQRSGRGKGYASRGKRSSRRR